MENDSAEVITVKNSSREEKGFIPLVNSRLQSFHGKRYHIVRQPIKKL